ncbi:hypothetical protein JCM31598_07800 [Desulfonatronum parangueonense]
MDAQTCKLIVLDRRIASMTEFKQIIGRGSRINEDYGKLFFMIMDFKRATSMFADLDCDGDPVRIYEPGPEDPPVPPEDLSADLSEGPSEASPDETPNHCAMIREIRQMPGNRRSSITWTTWKSAWPRSGSSIWTNTAS